MSHLLLDHTGAHIILDQPPNVIHVPYEFGRTFNREGAWPRQLDGHALPQPTRPAREDEHAVGQKHRLVDLVGDEQDRLAASFPDAHELRLHDLAGLRVERRERLVHQQNLRVDRQRTREIDPLAHAARELARMVIFESVEADELQELLGALPFGRAHSARHLPPDDRVCEHGAPRQEVVGLEYEPAAASTITPANRSGILNASADWAINRPSPAREPNSSATTTPISPRPMPSLSPARMNGTADGSETLKKIWRGVAPKERSISMSRSLVVRKPASVLMVTGNSTRKMTTNTFDQMPMPSQRMNRGASAIVGVA